MTTKQKLARWARYFPSKLDNGPRMKPPPKAQYVVSWKGPGEGETAFDSEAEALHAMLKLWLCESRGEVTMKVRWVDVEAGK